MRAERTARRSHRFALLDAVFQLVPTLEREHQLFVDLGIALGQPRAFAMDDFAAAATASAVMPNFS